MVSRRWAAWALVLALPFLHACGMDDAQQGKIRLVNATTEFSTLDLYREDSNGNDVGVLSGVTPGTASGYTDVDRGSATFDIGTSTSATPAFSTTGSVTKQHDYTIIASLTGSTRNAQFISDDEDAPNAGKAKLRIYNTASTEVGGVDVYLVSKDCTALDSTDTAFATDVNSLGSYTQFSASSSGTNWHVCVTATGDTADLRLNLTQVTFKDQEIATLVLTRTPSGVLLNAAVLDQQGSYTPYTSAIARVRLVADAAAAATVTATFNGVALGVDSPSPTIASYVTVPSGAVTAALQIDDVALNGLTLPAASAGGDYTLLVAGTAGAPTVQLLADNNTPSTSTSQPVKVRVVDGVNDISGGVSGSVAGTAIATNVTFATASSYATVAANGSATVTATGGLTPPTPLTTQTFTSGSVYTIFVLGDASAPQIMLSTDR